jgi:hypothetical protein
MFLLPYNFEIGEISDPLFFRTSTTRGNYNNNNDTCSL